MYKRFITFALISVLFHYSSLIETVVGLSGENEDFQGKEQIDFLWGESRNGVSLGGVAFKPIQTSGQPVLIRYQLKNNAKESIRCYIRPSVELIFHPYWAGGYIQVVTQDFTPLVCNKPVPFPDKGVDVAPGNTYSNKIDLSQYFDFPYSGVYKACLTLRVHPSKDPSGNTGFGVSSGEFQIILEEDKTKKPWNSFNSDFALDREIPVNLEWGTKEDPRVLVVKSVRFEVKKFYSGSFVIIQPHAFLKIEHNSWPKTSWEISIILIDETGKDMGWGQTSFSNSGVILGVGMWSKREDDITLTLKGEISGAKKFRISVRQTFEEPSESNVNTPFPEEKIPDNTVMIGYVDDSAEGKKSIAASGHAVKFQAPPKARFIEAVQIFASRYGNPKPPDEDFHLYILNEQFQVLADLGYPYGMITRDDMKWYALRTKSVEVPENFYVALSFNAHQTKGVYLGYDENVEKSHSFTGLPEDGYNEIKENRDWMIRVYLSEKPSSEKGVQLLSDWKPSVYTDPFEGCIEVKYDAGESEHIQSYGGGGPAVKINKADFDLSGKSLALKGFRLYASRYGSGYDTNNTFLYASVLDPESNLIQEFAFPYSLFSYKGKWVNLVLEKKLILDEKTDSFYIFLDPEAHQYKGIYFHYNKDPKFSHSFVGKFEKEFRELSDREWVIRAYLEKSDSPPRDVYLVSFKASPSFKPENPRRLLKKFNEILPPDITTGGFRFEEADENLIGAILVYGNAEKDRVKEILNQSEYLELVQEKKAEPGDFSQATNIKNAAYKKAEQKNKPSPPLKGRSWGPEQATGAPDTPDAGDTQTAWASLTADGQDEWLLLEYETDAIPSRIDIHETFNPGAVNRVTVFDEDGEEIEVWKGDDPTPPGSGKGVSKIPVNIDFKTNKVKIYIDSKKVSGWNEIDAVGLVDKEGKSQWAKKAEASSTYAEKKIPE